MCHTNPIETITSHICAIQLRLTHRGRDKVDVIFKWIFLNENICILIGISLKFAPKGLINNITALAKIMAWRRPGNRPLSELMMVSLLTHICVTRPRWVKGWSREVQYYTRNQLKAFIIFSTLFRFCTFLYKKFWKTRSMKQLDAN